MLIKINNYYFSHLDHYWNIFDMIRNWRRASKDWPVWSIEWEDAIQADGAKKIEQTMLAFIGYVIDFYDNTENNGNQGKILRRL